jgi:hypothetical protein
LNYPTWAFAIEKVARLQCMAILQCKNYPVYPKIKSITFASESFMIINCNDNLPKKVILPKIMIIFQRIF